MSTAAHALAPVTLGAGTVPDPGAPHLVLWNTAGYAALRTEMAGRRAYDHVLADTGRLLGTFSGVVVDDAGRRVWTSGHMAPYGSVDVVRDHESVDLIGDLVAGVVGHARALGVDEVRVRTKPPHHAEIEPYVTFELLQRGFTVAATELNGWVDLRGVADADAFEAGLRKETRKALRAARRQALTVEQVGSDDDATWLRGHEVLRRNRVAKGRPMHLTTDYLLAIRDAFPGLVRMLVVRAGDAVVAASVVYRVARARDYVVYWGDADHALDASPMPLLATEVLTHCLASGAATVDLGVCSADGAANPGLVQFKRSIGARFENRFELRALL